MKSTKGAAGFAAISLSTKRSPSKHLEHTRQQPDKGHQLGSDGNPFGARIFHDTLMANDAAIAYGFRTLTPVDRQRPFIANDRLMNFSFVTIIMFVFIVYLQIPCSHYQGHVQCLAGNNFRTG
jgi:hypothetical protein